MVDAGRLVYTLTAMSPEEAKTYGIAEDERKQYVRMDPAKVNLSRSGGPAKWFHLVGVRLGERDRALPQRRRGADCRALEPARDMG